MRQLLRLLLNLSNPMLDAGAAPVDLIAKASLHPLKLVEHQPEIGIHRIVGLRAARIVIGIGFHRIGRI
jgi:hypothetical protein